MNEATPGAAAAETKMQDSLHSAAPQTEAKSLQPLLDALHAATMELTPVWEKADGNDYVGSYLHGFNAARDAAVELVAAAALGNRTPARQEERPDGKGWRLMGDAVMRRDDSDQFAEQRLFTPRDVLYLESASAPLPVQGQEPWDEALHGYTMLGSTKAYCCYGMYADVGHSSDCKHAKQKGQP